MKQVDVKHIAFHVTVGVYIVWLIVFGLLLAMAFINASGPENPELSNMLLLWIFFNLVMGTVLFIVIRLFRNNSISRFIFYSFFIMAAAAVTCVLYAGRLT